MKSFSSQLYRSTEIPTPSARAPLQLDFIRSLCVLATAADIRATTTTASKYEHNNNSNHRTAK